MADIDEVSFRGVGFCGGSDPLGDQTSHVADSSMQIVVSLLASSPIIVLLDVELMSTYHRINTAQGTPIVLM